MIQLASDAVIREKELKVLYKHLGETDAVRFLSQISTEKKDYLKTQHKLFHGLSVDELYDRAAAYCAEGGAEYKGKNP